MVPKGYLIGNLTSDPRSGVVGSNSNSYSRFSVACEETWSKVNSTPKSHFFNCIAWGKTAQFIQSFLKKGDKVFLEYSLTTGKYTNKEGREVRTVDLVVQNVESLSRSAKSNEETDLVPSEDEEDDISIDDIYSKD
ncbi:single-stranded DNA-binding family protein [Mycoplasma haemocanis str. Illinois]|uniref:Single-stranded DNA-binding protein n=1 Tax=Mycoplasma haemocanis (strain Illinois) TaxID=1111676 RepID=H6N5W7_MYCHN|nr:single-stranded DNA-binding protein [Mycoplasma haemocanis]AEW44882.1 single-stranded DNA-binding family protein [Mycoplasma haemocanis str. Illinois]